MAANTILGQAQALNLSALVDLYEIDMTPVGQPVFRFHTGMSEFVSGGTRQPITWQGNTYAPMAAEATGFMRSVRGTLPRPRIRVGNTLGAMTQLCRTYNDLMGLKVTRKKTLAKYLDAVNFVDQPSYDIDFTKASLTPSVGSDAVTITVARAGNTATRVNAAGLIEIVNANLPRFDYDPLTLLCKGILIEPGAINLATRSAESDHADWAKANGGVALVPVVTANTAASPDGGVNAERVQFSLNGGVTTNDISQLIQAYAGYTSGVPITYSVYLKSNTGASQQLSLVNFNTQSANITVTTAWQRFVWTMTPGATTGSTFGIRIRGGFGHPNTADILVWGHQLEATAQETSYIPTPASAAVTRNGDDPSLASLGAWFNALEGTLVAETTPNFVLSGTEYIAAFNDGSGANRIGMAQGGGSGIEAFVVVSNAFQFQSGTGAWVRGTTAKQAMVYKANDFATSFSGGAVNTDLAGTIPVVNRLSFGSVNGGAQLNGWLRRFTYYPRRMSDTLLPTLPLAYTVTADPNKHFADEVYTINQRAIETKEFVEFELLASWDVHGVTLPRRMILANACWWRYKGDGCGYAGNPVADINDVLLQTPYLSMAGAGYASAPDSAANSSTGDLDIIVKVALNDWTPPGYKVFVAKWDSGLAQNRSYVFYMEQPSTGFLGFGTSADGVNPNPFHVSNQPVPVADGGTIWVRVQFDANDGLGNQVCKFLTSVDYNPITRTGTWTQLGSTSTIAGAVTIFNNNQPLLIGAEYSNLYNVSGKIFYAEMSNTLGGTPVVKFNPWNGLVDGATLFTSSTGEVWTINTTGGTKLTLPDAASKDVCSHRLGGCRIRFPNQPIPFGNFPGAGRV